MCAEELEKLLLWVERSLIKGGVLKDATSREANLIVQEDTEDTEGRTSLLTPPTHTQIRVMDGGKDGWRKRIYLLHKKKLQAMVHSFLV